MEQNNTFEYTYSAERQREVEAIRKKYEPKKEDKIDILRKMDKDAEKPGTVVAVIVGIIGTLIFGMGMTCTLLWKGNLFIPGIFIGILGIVIMGAAVPICKMITKKQREKIAPQILALSEELLK